MPIMDVGSNSAGKGSKQPRHKEVAITERDVELLRYITRHGVCTGQQLGSKFFADSGAVWRRLRLLERLAGC